MKTGRHIRPLWGIAVLGALVLAGATLAGCFPSSQSAGGQTIVDQASSEATAIVQQAQATALIANARATANALQDDTDEIGETEPEDKPVQPTPIREANSEAHLPTPSVASGPTETTEANSPSESGDLSAVQLLGVSVAPESGLIAIEFKAPPEVARRWNQGVISVLDETTGVLYNQVAVMPVLGPMVGRPATANQVASIMLVNSPPGLARGATVTVTLRDFKKQHITVR